MHQEIQGATTSKFFEAVCHNIGVLYPQDDVSLNVCQHFVVATRSTH